MKKILLSFFCAYLVSVFSMSYALDLQTGRYDQNGELITVVAKGLVCDFCAKALEKVLMKQEEVSGINVDLNTKEILISLKQGKTLNDTVVTKLIVDSGYNVESITRKAGI